MCSAMDARSHHDAAPAYGLWTLVVPNSAVFPTFAFSFARPRTPRFFPSWHRRIRVAGE